MPKIFPFQALVYHASLRSRIHDLVSPPYDVISPEQHQTLKNKDPLNSVRLCLVDDPTDPHRYQKIKNCFEKWKKENVFEKISIPAFYLLEEIFQTEMGQKKRLGFVGLLEVSPFDKKEVLPHEFTLSGPKLDRLELLKTMGAECSQIFLCYRDKQKVLEAIHEEKAETIPFVQFEDPQNIQRKMWLIQEAAQIQKIQEVLSRDPVLIADGHHRYETAVKFHEEEGGLRSATAQCYFTNLEASDFSILPIHRLFSLPQSLSKEAFESQLKENYHIGLSSKLDSTLLQQEKKKGNCALFCIFQNDSTPRLLIQEKKSNGNAEIFSIQKNIFEMVLGWNISQLAKGIIRYEHTTTEFMKTLNETPRGVGLFLPATDLQLVMRLAERGERMPQKSTFFYPKLASGLINYELP